MLTDFILKSILCIQIGFVTGAIIGLIVIAILNKKEVK